MKNSTLIIGALLVVAVMGSRLYYQARGLRNSNPLNIKWDGVTDWQGSTGQDGPFVRFMSPEYGYRAAARILDSYARRGVYSIRDIIAQWAPEVENDTAQYTGFVVKQMAKVYPAITAFNEVATEREKVELFKAMTKFENGLMPYSDEIILAGIRMA